MQFEAAFAPLARTLLACAFALGLLAAMPPARAGEPVPDIGIGLEEIPGGIVVATTKTDRNGNYTFRNVRPGNYKVVITSRAIGQPAGGARSAENHNSSRSNRGQTIMPPGGGKAQTRLDITLLPQVNPGRDPGTTIVVGPDHSGIVTGTIQGEGLPRAR